MGGILSQGKIWTVPFHETKTSEMEQSKFYRAIIFLQFHELKPINICLYNWHIDPCHLMYFKKYNIMKNHTNYWQPKIIKQKLSLRPEVQELIQCEDKHAGKEKNPFMQGKLCPYAPHIYAPLTVRHITCPKFLLRTGLISQPVVFVVYNMQYVHVQLHKVKSDWGVGFCTFCL